MGEVEIVKRKHVDYLVECIPLVSIFPGQVRGRERKREGERDQLSHWGVKVTHPMCMFVFKAFGEGALESSTGKRAAGKRKGLSLSLSFILVINVLAAAYSRKAGTHLLVIEAAEYKSLLSVSKSIAAMEARLTLISSVVFKDWEGGGLVNSS